MWTFCLNSLIREYGWQFVARVALPHPVRTAAAVFRSGELDFSGDMVTTSNVDAGRLVERGRSIVSVGFCLKPMRPPCPSGRPNHDCEYLEHRFASGASAVPVSCRDCAIREIGVRTLKAGAAFYIMTSAKDILFDVFLPALRKRTFLSGVFALCRYSLRPFTVGLLASGIQGWLFPFERGDCKDYRTWLQADRGIKDDRTSITGEARRAILELLGNGANEPSINYTHFERHGNVLYSRSAAACQRSEKERRGRV